MAHDGLFQVRTPQTEHALPTGLRKQNSVWASLHSHPAYSSPPRAPGPEMPLTTLSSGTDRLSVHSWLFTKASVIEDGKREETDHNKSKHSLSVIFGRGDHESRVLPATHVTPTLEAKTCPSSHMVWPRGCGVQCTLHSSMPKAPRFWPFLTHSRSKLSLCPQQT